MDCASCGVSVIMSVYNGSRFLDSAIISILEQTYDNFEFIIINDGSTDASLDIIRKYAKADSRIMVIENPGNLGLAASLNRGLAIARGKYIARMDADDIALKDRLKIQFDYLEDNPGIWLAGSSAQIIDEEGRLIGITNVIADPEKIKRRLLKGNCIIHPSIIFRNEKGFCYREKALFCEDYDLYLRLTLKGKRLSNISQPLIQYRLSLASISFKKYYYARLFLNQMKEIALAGDGIGDQRYELFEPNEILKTVPPKKTERYAEELYIGLMYEYRNKRLLRNMSTAYLTKYGFVNKMLLYYLVSFFIGSCRATENNVK